MKWSEHQECIFDFCENGTGNAIVEAVAGSGKTTTIVEAINRLAFVAPDNIFLAFNKSIATELQNRGANAKTFHSLCYTPVTKHLGVNNVDMNKTRFLCDQFLETQESRMYSFFISRLISLAKQMGVGIFVDDTEQAWYDIVNHFNLQLENDRASLSTAIELSREMLTHCNKSNYADFDDLLYFAVKDGVKLKKYDVIFVDEAQDTNPIQRALLKKLMHEESRLIAVGDPHQAIYGFRGADSNAMGLIADEFNCERLPLTVSYRCPQSVVKFAKQWVSHIEAAPTAPEGQVLGLGSKWPLELIEAGDMVVCRNTKPLVQLAYRMMVSKNSCSPYVLGKDIGKGLISLINRRRAKDIPDLCRKLEDWRYREIEKAKARYQDELEESINDRYEAIIYLVDNLPDDQQDIHNLIQTLEYLFSDKANAAQLSTVHKAKGLEADRVFWLNSSKCPSPYAKKAWEIQQELNICYVAATRAKKELILIEEGE